MNLGEILDKQKVTASHSDFKVIEAIKIGTYRLSIQASGGHYCKPREIRDSYKDYDSFELMLTKEDETIGEIINDPMISNFPRYRELLDRYDGSNVFGWVKKDVMSDLIDYLTKEIKLKMFIEKL